MQSLRNRFPIVIALLALAFSPVAPSSVRAELARPGEVLVARELRRQALAQLPAPERERLCGATIERWPSYRAKTTIRAVEGYGGDDAPEPFAWTVMRAAAAAFGTGDAKAKAALINLLRRWARGQALSKLERDDAASWYVRARTLLPTIIAWGLVGRDDPELAAETRELIDGWLAGLVARIRAHRLRLAAHEISARNNHAYLAASVVMAWGALIGDRELVEAAAAVYQRAIADMRPDGSLPLETMRGARALWYQRQAIASLVTIAQMAEVQGIDLWSYRLGPRSIHSAVRFLLDSIDNPQLVWKYAKANVNPGPSKNWMVQELGFMQRRGHGRHYMAWAEIYMARFPNTAESQRLAAALAAIDPEFRPMIDEFSGGNTSCLFYTPQRGQNN